MNLFRNTMCRALALTTGCCAIALAQETANANWSVSEVSAGTMQEIRTPLRALTPTPGSRLLDVQAVIHSARTDKPAIQAGDIYVESPEGARYELAGIGVVGYNECVYSITEAIESTYSTVHDDSGNGFKLQAPTKDKPRTIVMQKNPDRLCLAFLAPEKANDGMTLHVGDATIALKISQRAAPQPAKASRQRIVVTDAAGVKAVNDNSGLQTYLNETMGVSLRGSHGETLAGKLVTVKDRGAVLFEDDPTGFGKVWVHLNSAEQGVWEVAGPEAVPLLVAIADQKDGSIRETSVLGLYKIGGPAAAEALTKMAANHRDPEVRKQATQLLEHLRNKPAP
jgi:hypothetical protein